MRGCLGSASPGNAGFFSYARGERVDECRGMRARASFLRYAALLRTEVGVHIDANIVAPGSSPEGIFGGNCRTGFGVACR